MSSCLCNTGYGYGGGLVGQSSNCICNFPTLVILILIVLQFSKCGQKYGEAEGGQYGCGHISNGILFIIALFFLSCAGCGKGRY
ncbi:hypothetical protein [Clostridium oryzae]|uniref:Uncharacterized protein n=1 Tax=Clostridium oryzae TaxID=1450648 RepID=A0A1V4IHG0_9CLOT|nr:hypothetical protein [Clostridium oryzae]OPJ59432.1 hypothetical protein CLORY_32740 [Clostridium oryzae]